MPFEPGQQVGRYRVIRLLAQGGMAEVYRAEQELAAGIFRPAALKVIRPEYSESSDFREMFLDEARTACTLSHPNIVHIYEVGEADGLLYMAMELVPGETLAAVSRTLRETGQRLSDQALLAVGIYTCSALEAVHALHLPGEGHLNLVHRDVSPHNLLLASSGSLKLIDFGIAKAATNRNLTSPGVTKGKAGYFSPEQAMGRSLDGRSDLFSLGITLYKLAAGVTPFDEHKTHQTRNSALVHGKWEPLVKHCPELPAGLHEVVNRALQVKPEDRFAGAREMREALEQVALQSKVHVGHGSLGGYVTDDGFTSARAPLARPPAAASSTTPLPAPLPAAPAPAAAPPAAAGPSASTRGSGEETQVERKGSSGRARVALSLPTRRKTEPMLRKLSEPAGPDRRRVLVGAAALLLLLGVAVALWRPWRFFGRTPPKGPLAVARVEPKVAPVEPQAPLPAPETPVALEEPAPVVREEPRREPRRPRPPVKVAVAEPKPLEIPKGEGRLRVGASPEGTVRVGRETWGPTPLDRKVSSGQYVVAFVGKDGKRGRCPVVVMPDKTTIVIYSFATNSCGGTE